MDTLFSLPPLIIACSFLALMIAVIGNCLSYLHGYRQGLVDRVRCLHMYKMLLHLGIDLRRYLRLARPMDVERQLLACEHCPQQARCDAYLSGREGIAPSFCPNFSAWSRYRPRAR